MKKFLFLFALLTLLLAGCGQQASQNQPEKFSGSIEDLLARNKSVKCELIGKSGSDILSGTTYVSGTKARSDFQMKVDSQVMTSHMINDGIWMYTWTDEMPGQAIKIKLDSLDSEEFNTEDVPQDTGLDDYQSTLDYNCYNWVKDDSLLTPPANVNFIDYSEFLQSLKNLNVGNVPNTETSSMCGTCDSLPDASAKASCLQSLGCQ